MTDGPTLAIASNNRGKIAELRLLLGLEARVLTLAELGLESPEETGSTFEENAVLKASYVYEETGLPALADDSGLEVDALDGRPGIHSARYSGANATDASNRHRLLDELSGLPADRRTARFVAVIAIASSNGVVHTRGACEGTIGFEERGTNGFGYDSIFLLPDGQTMAEISPESKNRISHRAAAMREALPLIRDMLGLDDPGTRVP